MTKEEYNEMLKLFFEKGFRVPTVLVRMPDEYRFLMSSCIQKWLIENYNIDVFSLSVRYTGHDEIAYYSYSVKGITPVRNYKYNSSENALEIGLQEGLKLI